MRCCCSPLIIEEFGLTKRVYGQEEAKVVVAVVADALIAAKRAGKPLMGAWIWQAATPGGCDVFCLMKLLSATAPAIMLDCQARATPE
jgi:hypothetical protein